MRKINVVGNSGSGKTTFGRKLAKALSIDFIEMDAVFWGKDWYWPSDDELFSKLEAALDRDTWVLDGNYTRTTPIKWKNIDTVIWIDYSFFRTAWQVTSRALHRTLTRKELWEGTGNIETFQRMFSKESIIWYSIKTYSSTKRKYEAAMVNPDYAHISFVRLKSPQECSRFLQDVNAA